MYFKCAYEYEYTLYIRLRLDVSDKGLGHSKKRFMRVNGKI